MTTRQLTGTGVDDQGLCVVWPVGIGQAQRPRRLRVARHRRAATVEGRLGQPVHHDLCAPVLVVADVAQIQLGATVVTSGRGEILQVDHVQTFDMDLPDSGAVFGDRVDRGRAAVVVGPEHIGSVEASHQTRCLDDVVARDEARARSLRSTAPRQLGHPSFARRCSSRRHRVRGRIAARRRNPIGCGPVDRRQSRCNAFVLCRRPVTCGSRCRVARDRRRRPLRGSAGSGLRRRGPAPAVGARADHRQDRNPDHRRSHRARADRTNSAMSRPVAQTGKVPEGDTIFKLAARLRPLLVDKVITRFEAPRLRGARPRLGERITSVEAAGKHLLIGFSGGLTLDTHLRMTGSWHLYQEGERWRRPAHLARAVVGVDGWTAVCFAAPVVQTRVLPDGDAGGGPLPELGPDLTVVDVDFDAIVARVDRFVDDSTTVAEALLDQRIACGIGNVFKSEVLHACCTNPFAPARSITSEVWRELYETASSQLRANMTTARRRTTSSTPGGLAVYGRARRRCTRCGGQIRRLRHGALPRSTYWCPSCQQRERAGDTAREPPMT